MSVVIETPNSPRTKKQANWEKYGWLFMRVSGPLLIVLVFTHLVVNLVLGEGIKAIDFAFVAGKWATPFWQWWDLAMLWLALIHGANGMRTIVNDYSSSVRLGKILRGAIYASAVILIVLGTLVIFTFDPCPSVSPDQLDLLPSFCPPQ